MPQKINALEKRFLEERQQDLKDYYAGYLGYDYVEEHGDEIRDYATALSPYMTVKEAMRILRK